MYKDTDAHTHTHTHKGIYMLCSTKNSIQHSALSTFFGSRTASFFTSSIHTPSNKFKVIKSDFISNQIKFARWNALNSGPLYLIILKSIYKCAGCIGMRCAYTEWNDLICKKKQRNRIRAELQNSKTGKRLFSAVVQEVATNVPKIW